MSALIQIVDHVSIATRLNTSAKPIYQSLELPFMEFDLQNHIRPFFLRNGYKRRDSLPKSMNGIRVSIIEN